jgi:uncharacterized repeat protein (TIGR01451 family)
MKSKLHYLVILIICISSFKASLYAQGPPGPGCFGVNIGSSSERNCNLADSVVFDLSFCDSTTVQGDTINFMLYFGDGDSAAYSAVVNVNGQAVVTYGSVYHYYLNSGIYVVSGKAFSVSSGQTFYSQPFANHSYYMGTSCGMVSGKVYNDCDTNCLMANNEAKYSNVKVVCYNNSGVAIDSVFTAYNGAYYFDLPVGTIYSLKCHLPYGQSANFQCPANGIYFDTIAGNSDVVNFGIKRGTEQDLIAFTGGAVARPGLSVLVALRTLNVSCSAINNGFSALHINSPLLTFDTAYVLQPASSSINSADWQGLTFPANVSQVIWVKLNVSANAQIGDTLCFSYTVGPDSFNMANNTINMCLPVRNSFDPNDKGVIPMGLGTAGYVPQQTEFTYTINFQNVGNASAYDITVIDSINPNLDITSFKPVSSSHNYITSITDGKIQFYFQGINLPDSTANNVRSNGSVTFKIKALPALAEGTELTNKAYIYFDNNPPIVTNTTLNTIELLSGIKSVNGKANFDIYPNPSNGVLKLKLNTPVNNCRILDFTGKIVLERPLKGAQNFEFDLHHLSAGLYLIQTFNNNQLQSQGKWIKN